MKKKIMIFMLLLSMFIGVGVPVQAKADEEFLVYDSETYTLTCPYYGYSLDLSKISAFYSFLNGDYKLCIAAVWDLQKVIDGSKSGIYCMFYPSDYELAVSSSGHYFVVDDGKYKDYNTGSTAQVLRIYLTSEGLAYNAQFAFSKGSSASSAFHSGHEVAGVQGDNVCIYAEEDIHKYDYYNDVVLDDVFFEVVEPYTFESWCSDAGLSCSASSNESSSVIPFWYEPDSYNYIVRKTLTASSTSGVYQLTMLQRKSSAGYYPYYFEVNNLGYLGVAGAFSDTSAFTVRNFYYDADGNGWKLQDKIDVSDLPFDHTNVTFDENVVFIYSDTDIYADREATSIWQPASTEYYNVEIPEPEITRVPINPGSGSVGGQAEPGGLLSFVITFFTLVWTKLFAVEVPVDGYMISFQQIIIWGAIAAVLGFLVFSIFKKR